jgi:hypothetical protein
MITSAGKAGSVTWGELRDVLNKVPDGCELLDAPVHINWIGHKASMNVSIVLDNSEEPDMSAGMIDVLDEGEPWTT